MQGKIAKVLVVGAGTMGAQISLDCALAGCSVTVWDVSDQALESLEQRQRIWAGWQIENGTATLEEAAKAIAGIKKTADARQAAEDADLMIEAVFEEINAKRNVFAQFEDLCPAKTIFTTNTSTLLPRDMETGIRRKAQFSAFHFNWPKTVIEIMRGSETGNETVELLREFARSIGYLPIYIQKEYPGFIHAALFGAWAITGVQLAAKGVASIEDIDRAWMRGDYAPFGPLGALDAVGLDLVMMILEKMRAAGVPGFDYEEMSSFLKGYIEKGDLGVKTGKGFYSYPNPAFRQDGFLK